ncbi:prepilin-type N-terminal cleavage/methylation domain-containing protein [Blautia obeum]|uniref:prepilin-type N-terminal cleavage/methylation domain-containing protein n=1 Tax=Blautia obeum TaxID=40520 RepID=UPI00321A93A5
MKKTHKMSNKGFTLVELIVVVAIFTILLGIAVPSLNSILGFRVNRAANSIASALDRTKIEASSRLVGEMKLEKRADGYYISYYLDRGKVGGASHVTEDDPEKIAPARTEISYTSSDGSSHVMAAGDSLILTYDRATGGFLPIQSTVISQEEILNDLKAGKDVPLQKTGTYCTSITVSGGRRYKTLSLIKETGKYSITAG